MTEFRILLVDDEPDIREIVDISLGLDPEFTTRACASGADALVMAAEWSPALILLDVMMPYMDGPTTLTNLRKSPRTSHIPVLFLTARMQTGEIEQYILLGARGVLSKPFNAMTLAASVRDYLPPSAARLIP
jgi:CheY-like chemotaxis protein